MYPQRFTDNNLPTTTPLTAFSWNDLLNSNSSSSSSSSSSLSPVTQIYPSPVSNQIPPSYPQPDASCFCPPHIPLEPAVLLALRFRTKIYTSDQIIDIINNHLSHIPCASITTLGNYWSCHSFVMSYYTVFSIRLYKSREIEGEYVIEYNCSEGDKWKSGKIYNDIKTLLTQENNAVTPQPNNDTCDNNTNDEDEDNDDRIEDNFETTPHCSDISDMLNSTDYDIFHEGIAFVAQICNTKKLRNILYESNIVSKLVNLIINPDTDNIAKQHILLILTHFCKSTQDSNLMKNYLTETEQFTDFVEILKTIIEHESYIHLLNHAVHNATIILGNIA